MLQATSGWGRALNIPHGPVYSADFAGYITLELTVAVLHNHARP